MHVFGSPEKSASTSSIRRIETTYVTYHPYQTKATSIKQVLPKCLPNECCFTFCKDLSVPVTLVGMPIRVPCRSKPPLLQSSEWDPCLLVVESDRSPSNCWSAEILKHWLEMRNQIATTPRGTKNTKSRSGGVAVDLELASALPLLRMCFDSIGPIGQDTRKLSGNTVTHDSRARSFKPVSL
jgi:hypothetical protein